VHYLRVPTREKKTPSKRRLCCVEGEGAVTRVAIIGEGDLRKEGKRFEDAVKCREIAQVCRQGGNLAYEIAPKRSPGALRRELETLQEGGWGGGDKKLICTSNNQSLFRCVRSRYDAARDFTAKIITALKCQHPNSDHVRERADGEGASVKRW